MAEIEKSARARSFGALADAYHRHRPGYPDAALDWVFESSGSPGPRPEILDLAAGTGKLTAPLLRRGRVHAVEPDPEMLAVLRTTLPAAHALAGTAEAIPLPDASVDAVLVGQALHWFDPEPAFAEIARVLRSGGVLAALWNHEDRSVEWVHGYYELVRGTEHLGRQPAWERTEPGDAFDLPATREFANPLPMTIDGLLDNLGTFSWISTLESAERTDTLRRARAYLEGRRETGSGPFELPMRTTVLRAARR